MAEEQPSDLAKFATELVVGAAVGAVATYMAKQLVKNPTGAGILTAIVAVLIHEAIDAPMAKVASNLGL
jgi:hypothetical protein